MFELLLEDGEELLLESGETLNTEEFFELTVGTASFVSTGPAGIVVSATASSPTGTYQWERNEDGGSFSNLSGKTSLTCTDATAVIDIRYGYRCKQTVGENTVTTNTVIAQYYEGGDMGVTQAELDTSLEAVLDRLPAALESGNIKAHIKAVDSALTSATIRDVKKNTALSNFHFVMHTTVNELATGKTVSVQRALDDGSFDDADNDPVEIGSGAYRINLSAADLNGDVVTFKFAASGCRTLLFTVLTQS